MTAFERQLIRDERRARRFDENIKNYSYKIPTDPEKLLYDFYFIIGYLAGKKDDPIEKFVYSETVYECVSNLAKHMLRALRWSLSAELRNVFGYSSLDVSDAENPNLKKVLGLFREALALSNDAVLKKLDMAPNYRKDNKDDRTVKDPSIIGIEGKEYSSSRRNATYKNAFLILKSIQKKLKLDDEQFADVFISAYEDLSWSSSYGGQNWANIAKAYKNLIKADTINKKIIWIDHAYDLQHNTGSVFTKVKAYNDSSKSSGWLAKALDWKRDSADIRDFYERVSGSLMPVVAWVAKHDYGLTLEQKYKDEAEKKSSAKTVIVIDPDLAFNYWEENAENWGLDRYIAGNLPRKYKEYDFLMYKTDPDTGITVAIIQDPDTKQQYILDHNGLAEKDSTEETPEVTAPIVGSLKNFRKFEVGKYYIWTAPSSVNTADISWSVDGRMDFMKDGKPHKCTNISDYGNKYASFEDQPGDKNRQWHWFGAEKYMKEVVEDSSSSTALKSR